MSGELSFRKSGKQIKQAVSERIVQLQERLDKRNRNLDRFLDDRGRVRSFVVRSSMTRWAEPDRNVTPLCPKGAISSEEIEETLQLCRRIFDLQQEIYRLKVVATHLDDEQLFELSLADLLGYGFEVRV